MSPGPTRRGFRRCTADAIGQSHDAPFASADHVAEQHPRRAVEAHQLHLLHRKEIGRAGVDVDLDPSSSIGSRSPACRGWGGSDEENWKLVLFLRHLLNLTPEEIRLMEEVKGGG